GWNDIGRQRERGQPESRKAKPFAYFPYIHQRSFKAASRGVYAARPARLIPAAPCREITSTPTSTSQVAGALRASRCKSSAVASGSLGDRPPPRPFSVAHDTINARQGIDSRR